MIMRKDDICGETCLEMLQGAQNYVKSLLEFKAPNSVVAMAWEDFYAVYDDLIRRFVAAQGVPRSDVEDCVQEVWSEIACRLIKFDRPVDRPGLRAWLFALVRSKATNVFRRGSRRPAVSLDQRMLAGHEPRDPQPEPSAQYDLQWKQAVVESMIAQLRKELPPISARLLQARLVEHRSVEEVAAELNLSPDQIYARQHRIMKELRARVSLYTGAPIGG